MRARGGSKKLRGFSRTSEYILMFSKYLQLQSRTDLRSQQNLTLCIALPSVHSFRQAKMYIATATSPKRVRAEAVVVAGLTAALQKSLSHVQKPVSP